MMLNYRLFMPVLGLSLFFICGCGNSIPSSSPRIEILEKLDNLAVLNVFVADVVGAETESQRTRAVYIARGNTFYTVDLSKVKQTGTDTFDVPTPKIYGDAIIDQNRSEFYDLSSKLGGQSQRRFRQEVPREAQKRLLDRAHDKKFQDMAKNQTVLVLARLLGVNSPNVNWID